MAQIISMQEKRLLKSMQTDVDLSLAHLFELTRRLPKNDKSIYPCSNLKDWFGEIISSEIIRRDIFSEDIILCGIYIASMLAQMNCELTKYFIDFLEKWSESSDPIYLKLGGDFCFVLCGGFSARCDRKMMKIKDYKEMGVSFYDWFYSSTGRPIGHYMSVNFELMQQIVNTVLTSKL